MICLKQTIFLGPSPCTQSPFVSDLTIIDLFIELLKNEAVFTNRAMAYIKQRKYKEALLDCE